MERLNLLALPQAFHEQPVFYRANRSSVVGPGADVSWPASSQLMDFELEFGIFIGKPGRDIPPEAAQPHIFGHNIFNDCSARDAQTREMGGQLGPTKGRDFETGSRWAPGWSRPTSPPTLTT